MRKRLFQLLLATIGVVLWLRRKRRGPVVDATQAACLRLGDLQLTILHRVYPEAADAWNRNWLTAEACATDATGNSRHRSGEIISAVHLGNWNLGLGQLLDGTRRDAVLHGELPALRLTIATAPDGGYEVSLQLVDATIGNEHFSRSGELAADLLAPSTHRYRVTRNELEAFAAEVRHACRSFPEMKVGDW